MVVKKALSSGKHAVVVNSDSYVGTLIWTKRTVDGRRACYDAVCCCINTKRRRVATIAFSGDGKLTLFNEAIVID